MSSRLVLAAAAVLLSACGQSLTPVAAHSPLAPSLPPASPTALTEPLAVPTSTPLIVFGDPVRAGQIDAVTWDGSHAGTLPSLKDFHGASPSGDLFGGAAQIWNRSGQVVVSGSFGAKGWQSFWADDGFHFCQVLPFDFRGMDGLRGTLELSSPVGGGRLVTRLGKISQTVTIYVAACSLQGNRAVVVESGGQGVGVAQYWVVQLSTGAVVWTHQFAPAAMPSMVVASHDGQLVSEDVEPAGGKPSSAVFGPDGSLVTHLDGAVRAFTWDRSMAVVDNGRSHPPALVAVADGSVRWSAPAGAGSLWSALAEPNGSHVAVGIVDTAAQDAGGAAGPQPVDVYVVGAGGKTAFTLRRVLW